MHKINNLHIISVSPFPPRPFIFSPFQYWSAVLSWCFSSPLPASWSHASSSEGNYHLSAETKPRFSFLFVPKLFFPKPFFQYGFPQNRLPQNRFSPADPEDGFPINVFPKMVIKMSIATRFGQTTSPKIKNKDNKIFFQLHFLDDTYIKKIQKLFHKYHREKNIYIYLGMHMKFGEIGRASCRERV